MLPEASNSDCVVSEISFDVRWLSISALEMTSRLLGLKSTVALRFCPFCAGVSRMLCDDTLWSASLASNRWRSFVPSAVRSSDTTPTLTNDVHGPLW